MFSTNISPRHLKITQKGGLLFLLDQTALGRTNSGHQNFILDKGDSKWDCKYHVVFVPKRRRKAIFGQARKQLGPIFHALARQKECQIIEGHLMPDHVHMRNARKRVHRNSTQAPGGVGDRVSERQERHRYGPTLWQGKKLRWRTLLGPRLCGIDRRVRTGAGPHLHPRAGSGGWSRRTILNQPIRRAMRDA